MRKAISYFVNYPILANIVIAITLLGGIASFLNTRHSFFPTQVPRTLSINVNYPGASPEEVEDGITQKIEEEIYNIAGIDEIISTSKENIANISVVTLKGYNIDDIYTEIKNAVDGISSFPEDAEKPIIFKNKPQSTTQWVALTGDVDLMTLKRFAEEIEQDFLASEVISQVGLIGFNPREISIEVSEANLRRYGLTFDQVATAVSLNNRDISAGSIKSRDEELLIRSKSKKTDAEKIGEIVLRSNGDGNKLLVKDVANIEEQWADIPNNWTLNGTQAVWIQVQKLETEDLVLISDYVLDYIEQFNENHSAVQLTVAFNFNEYLSQRIDMLTTNGAIGLILVLVSLGFFLNVRLSAWVAWGIPSSFLGLFLIGSFVGLTINMISLFGMILVIGILVDDGIVIAENIYAHFEKHQNPVKAAINGTMEVLPAVTTSVTTTIVAFSPLLILTGGFEFLKDMAIVVIFSLAFSLLEAFFVLPAHLASKRVLKIKPENTRGFQVRAKINQFIDWLRYTIYGSMLRFTMKYKAVTLAAVIGLFFLVAGLFQGGFIKATFFPNIPFASFQINLVFKPGTTENNVERYLADFEDKVWEVNEDINNESGEQLDLIEFTFSGVGNTMDGTDQGRHTGGINIFHKELDGTGYDSYDLIEKIRARIGEVPEAEKLTIGSPERFGKPVAVRLIGEDMQELKAAKDYLKNRLKNFPDSLPTLKEIKDDYALGNRELLFNLKPEAYFLGFTHQDITRQVRQGFFGEEVQRLQKGKDEVKVWVRYPESGRINLGQIEEIKIKDIQNQQYPLTQVADYRIERGIAGIRHYDTERQVIVDAGTVDPFAEVPLITRYIKNEIGPEINSNFPGVEVDYGGQAQESERAQQEIGTYFGGAFIIIIFLIMITFRSFYQTLMIIMMIPFGWLGSVLGHGIETWITVADKEYPVSLLSAWGMIALSGVIINDAVVFLAKYNTLLKEEGSTVHEAAYKAGLSRFRPIILTSITTVAGLYPLIKESSFQAQFLIPMAISVAYGVLIGTFIILLFFPVLIVLFNDVRRYAKWLWTGNKPTPEEVERVIIDSKRVQAQKEFA